MNSSPAGEPDFDAQPRHRNALRALAVALVASAGGAASYAGGMFASDRRPTPPAVVPTATATVHVADITQSRQDSATLGFDGDYTAVTERAGTVTWLPAPGTVIAAGNRLFDIDDTPTTLLLGSVPAWRAFTPGMSDGPDVRQLQQNLHALGFGPHLAVDGRYGTATVAAVDHFLAALGVPVNRRDGTLALGSVVFLPETVRVTQDAVVPGALVSAGSQILTATSNRSAVLLPLSVDAQSSVEVGAPVRITLPDGSPTSGHVTRIGHVATLPDGGGSGSGQQGQPPVVDVTIGLDTPLPAAAAGWDRAPVQVGIVTAVRRHVLTAPIMALIAGPHHDYQVRIVAGGTVSAVTVTTGLFDDISGTVEITGPGMSDGTLVEVPAS
ncbi:peptidoglycan-binding domain-containing protein [Catenulispora rubra]|uniref:peptidoglycan-binding domain-containing protein n=1 Tax=Catenulispora rubra TaxID=280293 RepID=UPI00189255AC|nr:peptidoglycan-binding domain-containing protein [Catenulispora rubra]